eukprot:TRINITY_DN105513_c0_g1_i1.p1 TRINITY_DN105513_c0_g1~~TRINITY_DN105513_c0_g1_i1.p1  ORF type:complete len:134 (-),score=39.00 TRINITY_DN105513_c0_g1_i1:180-581(-)
MMRLAAIFTFVCVASGAQVARISDDVLFGDASVLDEVLKRDAFSAIAGKQNVRERREAAAARLRDGSMSEEEKEQTRRLLMGKNTQAVAAEETRSDSVFTVLSRSLMVLLGVGALGVMKMRGSLPKAAQKSLD